MALADNYFIILGLGEFKPNPNFADATIIGTSDDDSSVCSKIKNAIDAKRLEWAKGQIDPRKGGLYKHYIELIPKIETEFLGVGALGKRKSQYADARERINTLLKKPLASMQLKGYISENEIERIAKQCNLMPAIVRNFATVEVRQDTSQGKVYPKPKNAAKYKDNDARLNTYGYPDVYHFLAEGSTQSYSSKNTASDCKERVDEIKASLPPHNKQDIADKKKVCEFCLIEVFTSEDKKSDHDVYLAYKRVTDVFGDAKLTASETKNLVEAQVAEYVTRIQSVIAEESQTGATKKSKLVDDLRKDAYEYLRCYCAENGIAIPTTALPPAYLCPNCFQSVKQEQKICPHCGGDIIVSCPKCGTEHHILERYCVNENCKYDFNNYKRTLVLCEKAKTAIDMLNLQLAKTILDEAEDLCNTVKEVARLRIEWTKKNDRFGSIVRNIKDYADKKCYISAKRDLDALKEQFPQYSNPELEEAIKVAITAATEAISIAKKTSDISLSCKHALEAYRNCRDFPGVQALMSKPPQVKVVTVVADTNKRANILSWNYSNDDAVTYRVIRKVNSRAIGVDDGDLICEIASGSYADDKIEANVLYHYAVVACIGPNISPIVHCENPVINIFEVQQLTHQPNRTSISAQWTGVPKGCVVEVWRDNASTPIKPGDGVKVSNVNLTEMVEQGLQNDVVYHYRIFIKYTIGATIRYSAGIAFDETPIAPPSVIDYVIVKHKRDNIFEVEWDSPDGDVVSFYLVNDVVFEQGQVVDISELSNKAIRANVVSKGDSSGEFELPDSRMYYFFPVTQKNNTVAIGAIIAVTAQKLLSISKVQMAGNDMYIKFDWPNEVNYVLLLYRNDRYAASPQDTGATRVRVTRAAYDLKKAITINNLSKGSYYFSLFAELQMSGTTTFSIPDFNLFRFGTMSRMIYDIKTKKSVMGALKSVSLVVTPPEDGKIPALSVIANNGGLPVFRSQGFVVCEVKEQIASNAVTIDIPLSRLSKNTFIKVFIKDESEAANYEITLVLGGSPCLK